MFNKLNNYLLSNYPLFWNTKIVVVLPLLLFLHLLFYLGGYLYPVQITELYEWRILRIEGVTTFSVLVTLVFIIFWLLFYLRNNPFKLFYTLGVKYLFFEFVILFVVFFSSSTFFFSYEQGLYHKINAMTRDADLKKEADLANLACHFMAFTESEFDIRYCCDSIKTRHIRDSVLSEERKKSTDEHGYNEDVEERTSLINDTNVYEKSYLYCCSQTIQFASSDLFLKDGEALNKIAVQWLKVGKKDSVLWLMRRFEALCYKYGVNCKIDPDSVLVECFNDARFTVRYLYGNSSDVSMGDLRSAMGTIIEVREGFWNRGILLGMLYYALAAAILLFSFRITNLKPWLTGIVGVGIWCILLMLIGVSLRWENGILGFLLFLWVLFFTSSCFLIYSSRMKLYAGVIFNWFIWLTPFVEIIIYVLLRDVFASPCSPSYLKDCPPPHPLYTWLDTYMFEINITNITVIFILMFLMFIPLARKWQSNPEE